ncbi:hypothetical protein BB934_32025 (plasmid) [Microvirga ossetica]|uniref:Uncharacterized protein n=2 Tax=Microvirga ossetica TaxID=1882682 RepID=A0A1B2ESR1_9HYPH|nr:hypothetical protein BB934_32025 [Microvirga ossetica]
MGSLITAAARALEAGDPLDALNRVAMRDDAPALALRGIAMVLHDRFPERDPMSARSGLGLGCVKTLTCRSVEQFYVLRG